MVEKRPRKKRTARKEEMKEVAPAAPTTRPTGARKTGAAPATRKGTAQATKTAGFPRAPRTSAATLTINKGVKISYADVLATARQKVPLSEIGVESLGMRKSMTGGGGDNYPAPRRQRKREGVATGDASNRGVGLGGGMRQRGGAGRRDPHHQIQPRDRVDKVPGGRSPEISPGREGSSELVHGEGHGHSEETPTVLQVPGAGARADNLHVQPGSRASVLQVRR
jgi:hypothetical protein